MSITDSRGRSSAIAIAAVAALITLINYHSALENGFVFWDDGGYVSANSRIETFDFSLLKWALTTFREGNYHPLAWISLGLDHYVWGKDPFGFHLTNVLLHAANTFLVVILIIRLFESAGGSTQRSSAQRLRMLAAAGIIGLLFGIHPLHVESVAWVSERKDVLYAFFFLLSLIAYLGYYSNRSTRSGRYYYGICLLMFSFSLLSKPMAVTLPAVMLILDVYPLNRISHGGSTLRQTILEKIPFFCLSIVLTVLTIMAQHAERAIRNYPFFERLLVTFRAIGFYLLKFAWPSDLAPYYPVSHGVFNERDVLAIAFFLAVSAFCIWSWRRNRLWLTVWAYYLVTLVPVLGLIKAGDQAAADRYTYLPILGPMFITGVGIASAVARVKAVSLIRRGAAWLTLLIILAIGAAMSFAAQRQIAVWKDSFSLWNREVTVYPDLPMAYLHRARVYFDRGYYEEAFTDMNTALRLNPTDFTSYVRRGALYLKANNYERALADLDAALRMNPGCDEALYFRSLIYLARGGYDRAFTDISQSIRMYSRYDNSYVVRGILYLKLGDAKSALADFDRALNIEPSNEQARQYKRLLYNRTDTDS